MEPEVSRRFPVPWKRSVLVLSLIAVMAPWAINSADAAGIESYRLAVGYYKRQKWDLATEEFRAFLKDLPDHPKAEKAEIYLGMSLINLRKFQDAREIFRKFIADHDASEYLTHAMYRRGECSFLLDDYEAAEKEIAAYLEKYPKASLAPRARYNLAESKAALKKYNEAVDLYQATLSETDDQSLLNQTRFGLAKAHARLNQFDQAKEIYQKLSAELSGESAAEALIQLADVYFDEEAFESAAATYAKLVEQYPESPLVPDAELKRGMSLYGAGQFTAAAEQLSRLADDEQKNAEAAFWEGVSLKSAGEYARAAQVLEKNAARLTDSPKYQRTLYHWADSLQRLGQYQEAVKHFLELTTNWPEHPLADEALHSATLAALKDDDLAKAEELVARFNRDYATSGLRFRQRLVSGRLQLAQSRTVKGEEAAKRLTAASEDFRWVLENSEIGSTQLRARYFLAYCSYELAKYEEALKVIEPLVEQLKAATDEEGDEGSYVDAYVLEALCRLKLKQYEQAATSASAYLAQAPQGEFLSQALSIRARAAAHLGDKATAVDDQSRLKAEWPNSDDFLRTCEELAEIAYANEDFQWAAELHGELAALEKDSPYRPMGLSGLGFDQYNLKEYEAAEATFAKFLADYPQHRLAAEAAFKHGASLREQGKIAEAAAAFEKAFANYEASPKTFVAGLAAARQYRELGQIKEADRMYAAVSKQFPKREDLDQLLDEWSVMHHIAENYEQSDAINRRIVEDFPDSPKAVEARLNLAVSDGFAGRFDDARIKFQAVIADENAKPQFREDALIRLMKLEDHQQQWEAAISAGEKLLADFPESQYSWEARYYAARANQQLKQYDKARTKLEELLKARQEPAPGLPENEPPGTIGDLPWFSGVWIMLAEIALEEKKYDDVEKVVEDFRAAEPKSPSLYYADDILGRSYSRQAKFEEARQAYQRVIDSESGELTETAAKCHFLLAETYFHQMQYEQATKEYLKVAILYDFPEFQAASLLEAGKCEELLKDWAEAVQHYDELISKYSDSKYAALAKERRKAAQSKINL